MPNTTGSPEIQSRRRRRRRTRRRAAGIVAQYIHELSERHAEQARKRQPAPATSQP